MQTVDINPITLINRNISVLSNDEKIALKLFGVLYLNNLRYDPPWESWTGLVKSINKWDLVDTPQLTNYAAFILSGMLHEEASLEKTKKLLRIIEKWMIDSQGNIFSLRGFFYPQCFLKSAVDLV